MMKSQFKLFVVVLFGLFIGGCASSGGVKEKPTLNFPYSQLKVMDLDQMSEIMYQKAKDYKKTEDPKYLQEGLLITYSRPNEDGLIEKISSIIKTPMDDNNLWESSVESLIDSAIVTTKNKNANAVDQVTYGVILENLVSELKPAFQKQYKSPGFETRMIEKIADADVEYSPSAVNERKLNLMRGQVSPSLFAKRLIERKEEILKK